MPLHVGGVGGTTSVSNAQIRAVVAASIKPGANMTVVEEEDGDIVVSAAGQALIPADVSVTDAKVAANAGISADKLADGATKKVLTAAERTKLAEIAPGATAYTDTMARTATAGTYAPALIGGKAPVRKDDLFFNVRDYGALGNGLVGDVTAIQAAIDAAATQVNNSRGAIVYVPKGLYLVNAQLTVPDRIRLVGAGSGASRLVATGTHTGPYMVRLGAPDTEAFGCRVEDIYLECSSVAGLGGVYSDSVEELSGLFRVLINNYRTYGVRFDGPNTQRAGDWASHTVIDGLHAFPAEAGANDGILLDAVANLTLIRHVTIGRALGTYPEAAIRLKSSAVHIDGFHIEGHTDGVRFEEGSKGTVTGAFGHSSVANVIHLAGGIGGYSLVGIRKGNSPTVLKDDITGRDSTIDLPFFFMGDGPNRTVISADPSHRWIVSNDVQFGPSTVGSEARLYVDGGALKFRGASGTVTTVAPA